jgi:hypothetical protein
MHSNNRGRHYRQALYACTGTRSSGPFLNSIDVLSPVLDTLIMEEEEFGYLI